MRSVGPHTEMNIKRSSFAHSIGAVRRFLGSSAVAGDGIEPEELVVASHFLFMAPTSDPLPTFGTNPMRDWDGAMPAAAKATAGFENWGFGGNGCRACPTETLGAAGRCGSCKPPAAEAAKDPADGRVPRVVEGLVFTRVTDEVFGICKGFDPDDVMPELSTSLVSALRFWL